MSPVVQQILSDSWGIEAVQPEALKASEEKFVADLLPAFLHINARIPGPFFAGQELCIADLLFFAGIGQVQRLAPDSFLSRNVEMKRYVDNVQKKLACFSNYSDKIFDRHRIVKLAPQNGVVGVSSIPPANPQAASPPQQAPAVSQPPQQKSVAPTPEAIKVAPPAKPQVPLKINTKNQRGLFVVLPLDIGVLQIGKASEFKMVGIQLLSDPQLTLLPLPGPNAGRRQCSQDRRCSHPALRAQHRRGSHAQDEGHLASFRG